MALLHSRIWEELLPPPWVEFSLKPFFAPVPFLLGISHQPRPSPFMSFLSQHVPPIGGLQSTTSGSRSSPFQFFPPHSPWRHQRMFFTSGVFLLSVMEPCFPLPRIPPPFGGISFGARFAPFLHADHHRVGVDDLFPSDRLVPFPYPEL